MMPNNDSDYKSLFSQLIKKQMLVLGPDITLAKVKNVTGITVDLNGDVQKIEGDPQVLLQGLINQFVELSGMIVKKTMESILTSYPGMMGLAATTAFGAPSQQASTQSSPVVNIDTNNKIVSSEVTAPQSSDTQNTVKDEPPTEHSEPPSITGMKLESLSGTDEGNKDLKMEPPTFSSKEMDDLNKALEDLAKAPLSTEATAPVKS